MQPRLLTPQEAAQQLAMSERQLRWLADTGQIKFVHIGNGAKRLTRRYALDDLDAFVAGRKQQCLSTGAQVKPSIPTTSGFEVVDFQALLARRRGAKPSNSRKAKGAKPEPHLSRRESR